MCMHMNVEKSLWNGGSIYMLVNKSLDEGYVVTNEPYSLFHWSVQTVRHRRLHHRARSWRELNHEAVCT